LSPVLLASLLLCVARLFSCSGCVFGCWLTGSVRASLVVFLDPGEPADALAINAVISMQLEVHEWFWLGCGWVPFPCVLAWLGYGRVPSPCYYLIEMQNIIILLQSTKQLNLQLQ